MMRLRSTIILSFSFIILATYLLQGCSMPSGQSMDNSRPLSYSIAKGYFVKNTYAADSLQCLLITQPNQLDELLGMAATMGANGRPTDIDFSRQYAIACIYPATEYNTGLQPFSLTSNNDTLRLQLKITKGTHQSFTMVPLSLLVLEGSPPAHFRWEVIPE